MYVPSIIALLLVASSLAFRHGDLPSRHNLGYGQPRFWGDEGQDLFAPLDQIDQPSLRIFGGSEGSVTCLLKAALQASSDIAAILKDSKEDWALLKDLERNLVKFDAPGAIQALKSLIKAVQGQAQQIAQIIDNAVQLIRQCF